MENYLAFVDYIGGGEDDGYIYRLDFTTDPDSVWGEYFNVAPSAIIPNLQPDINSISINAKVKLPSELVLAKKNYCFSMQDCFDSIIPLCFSEIDDNMLEIDNAPFSLHFAEPISSVSFKLASLGAELYDITEIEHGDDSPIDTLLDNIETLNS